MGLELTKDSVDLGIVVADANAALAFYRDTLGFAYQGEMPVPGGGKMHRLLCGTSLIKLVSFDKTPQARPAPGGLAGGTGYRYWTISVSNLDELTRHCEERGYKIAVRPREIRPGIKIAMIEDPEGNWVELLQTT
jgi:catechol 2,3-dioxygenase-like lactoylglutathione lyase family enzyme